MTVTQLQGAGQPGWFENLATFFGQAAVRSAFPTSTGDGTTNVFYNNDGTTSP
jgi:hypothetical protein